MAGSGVLTSRRTVLALAAASFTGLALVGSGLPVAASTAMPTHQGPQSPAVASSWPQFRYGPARNGVNPAEHTINSSNVGSLTQKWSFHTGGPVRSSPAVVGGVVFIGSNDGKVYALNAATGALVWSRHVGTTIRSSPAVVAGTLYVGSSNHLLYALNAASGAVRWTGSTGGPITSSPAVSGALVYIGSQDGSVYAFPAAGCGHSTCTARWARPTGGAVESSPAVWHGSVYIGSDNGNIDAFNATTGTPQWSTTPPAVGTTVKSTPLLIGGGLYIGACCGPDLYKLNASTGAIEWSAFIDAILGSGNIGYGSPGVVGSKVFIGGYTGFGYFESANGRHIATYEGFGEYFSSPAIANGLAFITNDSPGSGVTMQAYGTGTVEGNHAFGSLNVASLSSPAIVNGRVFAGADDGNVYAFGL